MLEWYSYSPNLSLITEICATTKRNFEKYQKNNWLKYGDRSKSLTIQQWNTGV